ncbi:MAG: VIT1/CCC1 transporter family protein [Alphaproteobacteria bacterium]|nr:VIT1/CCC1 transporter family protein [Alphaproteobacteria bacterium]MDE2631367.1 VIT1/CCC1 transporter family protein [Alphaproteobacteria bacterium]
MAQDSDAARYRANLQGEVDSASLYRALAEADSDPRSSDIFRKLAAVEDAHAEFWRKNLRRVGSHMLATRPGWRTRALAWLARHFGPQFVLPTINILEHTDSASYDRQPEAVERGLPAAERSHARVLDAMAGRSGGLSGSSIARLEGRHRAMGGNALRAAVLGANDGLVSNLSLVMGVTGAATAQHVVLLTGVAGLFAGACAMAMGEWLSVNSARELYAHQVASEAEELKQAPDEEREELVLIYQAKGLGETEARALATRLMANKDTALDTLVREELGIDPEELGGSAWAAAGWSFCLFAGGAAVPVLPLVFLHGAAATLASIACGVIALAGVGAGTSLFTGRSTLFSAARQVGIGVAAAAVTYGMGMLAGVALAG